MKFSLRQMLALMLLSSLGFAVYRVFGQYRVRTSQLMVYQEEIKRLRKVLRLDDEAYLRKLRDEREQFADVHLQADIALAKVVEVQERYGRIEERGPDVLSLRSVPQLALGNGDSVNTFRIQIPASRPAWLKFGVVSSFSRSSNAPSLDRLPIDRFGSDFQSDHSGPFESRLASGERLIDLVVRQPEEGHVQFQIRVDGVEILDANFFQEGLRSKGGSSISGLKQVDFNRKRGVPWLYNRRLEVNNPNTPSEENERPLLSVWLSEQSTEFLAFPGVDQ